jgi:CDP-diacylglycerol--glycerol-3-phosphate 3-phosphatidyltransferase
MISEWLRIQTKPYFTSIAALVARTGVSPNVLTLVGTSFMVIIGIVLATGNFRLGAILIIVAAIFDALDGSLARLTNQVTRFGAFLDSTLDRWAEAALYGGLMWWFLGQGAQWEPMLIYASIVGSLLVSYTRARAEGVGLELKDGLFTRFERFFVLVTFLLLDEMLIGLTVLALFSNLTAVQRLWLVHRTMNR